MDVYFSLLLSSVYFRQGQMSATNVPVFVFCKTVENKMCNRSWSDVGVL